MNSIIIRFKLMILFQLMWTTPLKTKSIREEEVPKNFQQVLLRLGEKVRTTQVILLTLLTEVVQSTLLRHQAHLTTTKTVLNSMWLRNLGELKDS